MRRNHMIIDAQDCSGDLGDALTITEFLNHVAGYVKGSILQSPMVVNKGTGLIGVMLTDRAHVAIHTSKDEKKVAFDIYCNEMFDSIAVRDFFMKYFSVGAGSMKIADVGRVKSEVIECEEPHCVNPAKREWRGRLVCQDHYEQYRDEEFEARRTYYH